MIIFLPERVYNYFEKDENYQKKVQELHNMVFKKETNYDLKDILSLNEDIFADIKEYMMTHISEELKDELQICLNGYDNKSDKFIDNIENYDDETKIFLLYVYNNGDMSPSDELFERYNKIVKIYQSNLNTQFSPFIYTIYYFVKLYLYWINDNNLQNTNNKGLFAYKNVIELLKYEDILFNEILKKFNSEQFFNILFHKRIQMMYIFLLFIGQFSENFDQIVNEIIRKIYNNRFKYDNFNYLKLAINHIFFQTYFDKGEFDKAKKYLRYNISIINYGFEHKYEMVKALNHFNKVFNKEFCSYLYYLYTMIRLFVPKLLNEFNILNCNNATEFEKRLLFGKLNSDERCLGIELNPNDWLSFKWCRNNKASFEYFNNIVDKIN